MSTHIKANKFNHNLNQASIMIKTREEAQEIKAQLEKFLERYADSKYNRYELRVDEELPERYRVLATPEYGKTYSCQVDEFADFARGRRLSVYISAEKDEEGQVYLQFIIE